MTFTRDDLLSSVRSRSMRSALTTADRYLATLQACLQEGSCPQGLSNPLTPPEWQRELKEAETRFVYCGGNVAPSAADPADAERHTSSGAILELEAVITTTRRDRDGDILESAGAEVDPDAVLLWQHIPFQPIGKLVQVTEHTVDRVKARLSIANTELGRDAATLAAFGAVKISHGFEPRVFEPLPDNGWHIKRFEIFEVSLVSIPSNRDAVITAFSRRKLHSPLVREWAREMSQTRPTLVAGMDLGAASAPRTPHSKTHTDGICDCGVSRDSQSSVRAAGRLANSENSLEQACQRFIARATVADPNDAPILRQTHAVLGKVIQQFAPP